MLLCAALLTSACGAAQTATPAPTVSETPSHGAAPAGRGTSAPASPPATAATAGPGPSPEAVTVGECGDIERPALQAGSHLIGGREPPVPYSSRPPTSGWHASGRFDVDVRDVDDPLTEPEQVSVLEADGVVVSYGPLFGGEVAALADHVAERYAGRVALTPYGQLDEGEVVFTSWGVLQRCDGVELAALDTFVQRFGTAEPIEPGH